MKFTSLSIAAHSTFNHFKSLDLLIDCGDGCATHLEIGNISALRTVLLTHAHVDHVAGLVSLIHLRRRFSTLPPLRILHADPCERLRLIDQIAPGAEFSVVTPGERILLGGGERSPYWAVPFPVLHEVGEGDVALGYQLWRRRSQRNPRYAGLTGPEMGELARSGATDLSVLVEEHLLTYTGDTRPLDPAVLGHPRLLMHEATYPRADMNGAGRDHSTLQDAVAAGAAIGSALAVNHLSLRYREVFEEDPEWKFPEGVQVVRPEAKPVEIIIPD